MAVLSTDPIVTKTSFTRGQIAFGIFMVAVLLTALRYAGLLPEWLHRIPEANIPDFASRLDIVLTTSKTILVFWFLPEP